MADPEIIVVSPLAGAYRGHQETRRVVTHAIFDRPRIERAFCGYDADSLADSFAAAPRGTLPSCPKCVAKLTRYLDNVEKHKPTRFPKGAGPLPDL